MSGGKTKERTDNTIDPWSRSRIETAANNARGYLNDNPFQAYEGERVAGLSEGQQDARQMFSEQSGMGNPLMEMAANRAMEAGGYAPQQVESQSFKDADLSGYMNPFTEQVINSTVSEMDRGHAQSQQAQNVAAAKAGAFGGSRHGIVEAEGNRNHEDVKARTIAGLNSDAFQSAAGMFNADAGRSLQADTTNAQLGLQGQSLGLQAGGLLSGIGSDMNEGARQDAQMTNIFGSQDQATDQMGMDADYQEFIRRYTDAMQRANFELGMGSSTPVVMDSNRTTQTNPGFGQIAGLALQGGALLASDRRLKRDIEPDGEMHGFPAYTYNYVTDSAGEARRRGVMAQDLLPVRPDAVHVMDSGFYAVDYSALGVAA